VTTVISPRIPPKLPHVPPQPTGPLIPHEPSPRDSSTVIPIAWNVSVGAMNPDMRPYWEIMRAYERMQAYERLIEHMTDEEREDLIYIADLVRQIENAISPLEDSLDDLATSLLFSTSFASIPR
jgi:hypothetical protein